MNQQIFFSPSLYHKPFRLARAFDKKVSPDPGEIPVCGRKAPKTFTLMSVLSKEPNLNRAK
jgi:hypothetical protein